MMGFHRCHARSDSLFDKTGQLCPGQMRNRIGQRYQTAKRRKAGDYIHSWSKWRRGIEPVGRMEKCGERFVCRNTVAFFD